MAKYITGNNEISSDDSDEENSDYLFIIRKLPNSTSLPIVRHGRVMKKVILNKWFWAHVKCYKF